MTTGLNRKQMNWGKAIVSIAVTLTAMPLTHILARMLKDGTTGVEQFYAGMGMGAFGLGLVIAGVFIKGDARQSLVGLFGGMFYCQPSGVSDTACYIRILDDGDDAVPVLYGQWM